MKRHDTDPDSLFDRAVDAIRNEQVDPEAARAAADRVQRRLSTETSVVEAEIVAVDRIEGCADFQSLIPSYLRKNLSDARAMLLEDHVNECVPCRRALKDARAGQSTRATRPAARAARPGAAWPRRAIVRGAIAAGLVAAFALLPFARYFVPFGSSLETTVEASEGDIFRVLSTDISRIAPGDRLDRGERIRTARDAGAVVRLGASGQVEMRERSELAVAETPSGITVRLDRGNVIVTTEDASHRINISTGDTFITIDGGTASITNGTKGTRVSSLDGVVHVTSSGVERVLQPGEQAASSERIAHVPVENEISWSRNRQQYIDTLAELAALRRDIDTRAPRPGVRTSTRLLDLMPADTVFYAALPNLTETLAESQRILDERIAQNAALKDWWSKERAGSGDGFKPVMAKLHEFGAYLGTEVAVGARKGIHDGPESFVVMADLKDAAGFRAYADKQIAALSAVGAGDHIRFVADPNALDSATPAAKADKGVYIWIAGDVLVASPNVADLQTVARAVAGSTNFKASPFYAQIAELYAGGVGIVVAADVEQIIGSADTGARQSEAFKKLGVSDLRYFIVEDKGITGTGGMRAVVTFNEQHRGITSWLAEPGPIGALEYISPDANVVTAFSVENPTALVDDLFGFVGAMEPQAIEDLKKFETEHGLNIRNDFAAPLGGEFAFAIDGPILPSPSWKMVFEVYDQARLQQTFERMATELNRLALEHNRPGFTLEHSTVDGRAFHALKSLGSTSQIHWTFADGYLIAAPNQTLVSRAIQNRESGNTILRSPRFIASLPEDGAANFSAVFYHDLSRLLAEVNNSVPGASENSALATLAGDGLPTLAYAYARNDRIEFAANTSGGAFGLSPSTLVGVPNAMGLGNILQHAMHGK